VTVFASVKSRLAVVLAAAWVAGAYFVTPDSYTFAWANYLGALLAGWLAIGLSIYGAFWVIEGGAIELPSFPKWAGYVLIAAMVFIIMGLPKALFN
jgi:hypothetical protein